MTCRALENHSKNWGDLALVPPSKGIRSSPRDCLCWWCCSREKANRASQGSMSSAGGGDGGGCGGIGDALCLISRYTTQISTHVLNRLVQPRGKQQRPGHTSYLMFVSSCILQPGILFYVRVLAGILYFTYVCVYLGENMREFHFFPFP